jgi:DNA-binding IclR family transcriptional regulator
MRLLNAQVMQLLQDEHPRSFTASEIVRKTGLSFSTVRDTLNRAREKGTVDRDLDAGLGGHTIYRWYYCGAALRAAE